ncbi:MAG: CDP-diacylglycerol diphosphatase [Mycobacterium sp.]
MAQYRRVPRLIKWIALASAFVLAIGGASAEYANADPNALWTIVHGQCVPDQETRSDPAPCSLVDVDAGEQHGYAVLKDLVGATQFLVVPTQQIAGIESPALLAPDATNYFAASWRATSFVDMRAGMDIPRDWLGLAINSAVGRTQDQLHIHVDCVRADVKTALNRHVADVGPQWGPFPEPLAGHGYVAMAVVGDTLDATNPIQLLAQGVSEARDAMGLQTLVTVGAYLSDGRPGFILLAGHADPATGNVGAGEELQDHTNCPPPRGQSAVG